jgi:hypothetical protein
MMIVMNRRNRHAKETIRLESVLAPLMTGWTVGDGVILLLRLFRCLLAQHHRIVMVAVSSRLYTLLPGLDVTRLFISLTAGAGTRCMEPSLFISNPVAPLASVRIQTAVHQKNRFIRGVNVQGTAIPAVIPFPYDRDLGFAEM